MGMWESRVLCEISKSLWKPSCGFHGDVISISIFAVVCDRADSGGCGTHPGLPIVVPGASYAVVFHRPTRPRARARIYEVLLCGVLRAQVGVDLGAPAPRAAFEDVRVMEQPIEERRDGGGIAQQLPPVVDGSI